VQNDGPRYYYSSQEIPTDFKQSIPIFFQPSRVHKESYEHSVDSDARSTIGGEI